MFHDMDNPPKIKDTRIKLGGKMLRRLSLSKKIVVLIVSVIFVTGLSVGIFSYFSAKNALQEEVEEKLQSILQNRKKDLTNYLDLIKQDLTFQSKNPFIVEAFRDYQKAWKELGPNPGKTCKSSISRIILTL
jgi:uncharacterized membrane protein YvbJ